MTIGKLKRLFIKEEKINEKEKFNLAKVQNFVEDTINNLRWQDVGGAGIKDTDYIKQQHKKKNLISISKRCGLGDIGAKNYMKSFMIDLLTQSYGVNENNINYIIDFNNPSVQDKFEILLYVFQKEFKYKALETIINKYILDEFKFHEDLNEYMYVITDEDIINIYSKEDPQVDFQDKLNIVAQRIYQNSKGLSVIDEIRDQDINGISIGVSGVPEDFVGKLIDLEIKIDKDILKDYKMSYESVWLYHDGKEIYLKFLSFGSQKELERVCQIIYKFNNPKQFSRSDGYIFNSMIDLTRVAVFRPPFAEGWCAFMRKFNVDGDIETLITGENSEIVKEIMFFIPRGKQHVAITGPQGAGKTTLLVALVKAMYGNVTIRVWEDFFETYFRIKLPHRNCLAVKGIDTISGENGLDALKKSNGQVTIISEAATDEIIKYIVKVSLTASDFTMFTHHAIGEDELVEALRNGVINVGSFRDEKLAEAQVLKTLAFNPHLNIAPPGMKGRVVERLTEFIVKKESKVNQIDVSNIEDKSMEEKFDALIQCMQIYFENQIGKKRYETRNIFEFDYIENRYVIKNNFSHERQKQIIRNLVPEEQERFKLLLKKIDEQIKKEKEVNEAC